MINKKYLLLLALFSISLASADVVIQYPQNITVKTGQSVNTTISIQNTYDFNIFDLQFSNLEGFTFENVSIAPNETKTINLNIQRNTPGSFNLNSIFSFKYLIDLPQGLSTYQVNITQTHLQPSELTIRRGDTVVWNNLDIISREISSAMFDNTIEPNQTYQFTYGEVGNYSYNDVTMYLGGIIQVINETELTVVNNPNYNKILVFSLDVLASPTTLAVSNSQGSYNINATGSKDGLLTIVNTGSEVANSISLSVSPDWINFDTNNFNLNPQETKYIVYHVRPKIYRVDDTNKTYSLNLRVSGINFNETLINISLSVPLDRSLSTIDTNEGFLSMLASYCEDHPNVLFCNNTIQQGNNGSILVQDAIYQYNLTGSEIRDNMRKTAVLTDTVARLDSKVNDLGSKVDNGLPQAIEMTNKSLQKQLENEVTANSQQWIFWLFILFGFMIIGIIATTLVIKNYKDNRARYYGGYDYKWK